MILARQPKTTALEFGNAGKKNVKVKDLEWIVSIVSQGGGLSIFHHMTARWKKGICWIGPLWWIITSLTSTQSQLFGPLKLQCNLSFFCLQRVHTHTTQLFNHIPNFLIINSTVFRNVELLYHCSFFSAGISKILQNAVNQCCHWFYQYLLNYFVIKSKII